MTLVRVDFGRRVVEARNVVVAADLQGLDEEAPRRLTLILMIIMIIIILIIIIMMIMIMMIMIIIRIIIIIMVILNITIILIDNTAHYM